MEKRTTKYKRTDIALAIVKNVHNNKCVLCF
jgi:hypothetical protein